MNRRQFIRSTVSTSGAVAALSATSALGANSPESEVRGITTAKTKLTPPAKGGIPVAILISEGLNVIDFSGPWGVFESVSVPNASEAPFQLYTVSDTSDIVVSGSGLKLKPHFTFADAPEMKVVVVPAQKGSDAMITWLKKTAPSADVTMSVCTGAFKLAKAGLLSGKQATTHHEFLDKLEQMYPDIHVMRGVRFVEGDKIATAGGLTSGTDLALRVVERYFGRDVAQTTADYMEYRGKGWLV